MQGGKDDFPPDLPKELGAATTGTKTPIPLSKIHLCLVSHALENLLLRVSHVGGYSCDAFELIMNYETANNSFGIARQIISRIAPVETLDDDNSSTGLQKQR